MNDISNLISVLRTEAKFHDVEVGKLFHEALKQLNLDLIKGEYDATPPTVDACDVLLDYISARQERINRQQPGKSGKNYKIPIHEEDEDG